MPHKGDGKNLVAVVYWQSTSENDYARDIMCAPFDPFRVCPLYDLCMAVTSICRNRHHLTTSMLREAYLFHCEIEWMVRASSCECLFAANAITLDPSLDAEVICLLNYIWRKGESKTNVKLGCYVVYRWQTAFMKSFRFVDLSHGVKLPNWLQLVAPVERIDMKKFQLGWCLPSGSGMRFVNVIAW